MRAVMDHLEGDVARLGKPTYLNHMTARLVRCPNKLLHTNQNSTKSVPGTLSAEREKQASWMFTDRTWMRLSILIPLRLFQGVKMSTGNAARVTNQMSRPSPSGPCEGTRAHRSERAQCYCFYSSEQVSNKSWGLVGWEQHTHRGDGQTGAC